MEYNSNVIIYSLSNFRNTKKKRHAYTWIYFINFIYLGNNDIEELAAGI